MKGHTTSTAIPSHALKIEALASMSASFEAFCLASGIEALSEMMADDAQTACGRPHVRGPNRQAHRWGKTKGKIGFHGGMIEIERPRLRGFDSKERALPSWEAALAEDWLGKWAMNQMLINVSTRKFKRSVRLPEGDVASPAGSGLSKSAVSRRFVALSAAHMKKWLASDLSGLDLLVIQIDGIHMDEDMTLVAAIGVDAKGDKHPLGLVEGATESAATVQALVENLIERGVDPAVPRLFIIDGSKALSKAIRRNFGRDAAIQRCQIHKAARLGAARVAASLGIGRCRQGREAASQSRATPRKRLGWGRRLDPGRHRGNPHRHPARITRPTTPIACLYQHDRECRGHGSTCLPKCEAMALPVDGNALDRRRHEGGIERLPEVEGPQATSTASQSPLGATSTVGFS
jgi:hypothetical protein